MTTATTSKVPAIFASLHKVHEGVGNIEKNGIGPASKGSFKYVLADDIIQKVHELLVANEVLVKPEMDITREVDRSSGRAMISVVVTGTLTFISAKDGSEFSVRSVGEGSSIGDDTATRKAVTQFQKIALLQTFSIPTGELDEEGVELQASAPAAENPKVAAAKRAAPPKDDLGTYRGKVSALAGKLGYASGQINELAADNGLTDAFNDLGQIKKLVDLLETLASDK